MNLTGQNLAPGIIMCGDDDEVKAFLTKEGRIDELIPQPGGNHILIGGQTKTFWWIAANFYNIGDDGYVLVLGAKSFFDEDRFLKLVTEVVWRGLVPNTPIYFLEPPKKEAN